MPSISEFWVRLEYPILVTGLYKRVRWLVVNGLEGIFHVYSNLRADSNIFAKLVSGINEINEIEPTLHALSCQETFLLLNFRTDRGQFSFLAKASQFF
jgi:hypothetical protein